MISYKPFYRTLLARNKTEYELIFKEGISANTLYRMKKGRPITTKTLDVLCFVLDCEVQDILEHDKETDTAK
ncbi:MAG: helix-turn-helix domain-containing protein [Oscillospiraceae bacterium]|nr:helix-turn-helix domain-containing protein [Oscillospiraceae bacterium]